MDYYRILGVNRNSTPEDIKKAYRKQVKQHHPDRGGDAEHFKRINEAYEILSNSDKRSAYDNPQPDFHFNTRNMKSNPFDNHNPFDNNPFGDMFGWNRPKNPDITLAANIELLDTITGKNIIVQYKLANGSLETVELDIPPGARQNDTIKFSGLGDLVDNRLPRGDLFVKIRIRSNKIWARENNNLVTKKTINVFDLMLGCVIIIKTLEGKSVKLNIPKGTKPGQTFSISGYGIPDINTRRRGNIYVRIDAEVPKIDDQNILNKLEKIRNKVYTKD